MRIPQRSAAARDGRAALDPLLHTAPVAALRPLPAAPSSAPAGPKAPAGMRSSFPEAPGRSARDRTHAGVRHALLPELESPFRMQHPLAQPGAFHRLK